MEISQRVQLEAQIGFLWGILVGSTGAFVVIMFFTSMAWYLKLFSAIGSLGIIGSIVLSLYQTIKARRNYLDAIKQMEEMNAESNKVIKDKVIGESYY